MLHLEFAVAPNQIRTHSDLSLLESRMGYEKGTVLSRFPKSWFKDVSEQLNAQLDGRQLDKATERLRRIKENKLVALGRAFEGESWSDAARNSHGIKAFHRLAEGSFDDLPVFTPSFMDLDDDDFVYISQYTRDATSLAVPASALLFGAEKVTIYDPYICPTKQGYRNTLIELMKLCKKDDVEFHVFSEDDKNPGWVQTEQHLESLKVEMPENIKLFWYCADDQGSGFLHARGLFTAKGGLIYDRGFQEPCDHGQRQELTNITPMSNSLLQADAAAYNTSQQDGKFRLVRDVWCSHQ